MMDFKTSPKHPILSTKFPKNSPCIRTNLPGNKFGFRYLGLSGKNVKFNGGRDEKRRKSRERQRRMAPCCSSSTSSAGSGVDLAGESEEKTETGQGQLGNLVCEFGWTVRRLVENEAEMRKVAQVQAEAFHVPVALFNDLFFEFFQAEVLAGLIYKLRNSPEDRYACLVAEPTNASELLSDSKSQLVGVVDVTVLRDRTVLSFLEGAEEYLYISGIAVLEEYRRQKVATVLLKACDLLSFIWGYEYLVLRAYDDDAAALRLYTNAGYRIVSGDPPWLTSWVGRKRRVLMIKYSSFRASNS